MRCWAQQEEALLSLELQIILQVFMGVHIGPGLLLVQPVTMEEGHDVGAIKASTVKASSQTGGLPVSGSGPQGITKVREVHFSFDHHIVGICLKGSANAFLGRSHLYFIMQDFVDDQFWFHVLSRQADDGQMGWNVVPFAVKKRDLQALAPALFFRQTKGSQVDGIRLDTEINEVVSYSFGGFQ